MPPQEIFGILDVLRSILVHFGTLVHHGKVLTIRCWYNSGLSRELDGLLSRNHVVTRIPVRYTCCARTRKTTPLSRSD